MRGFKLLFFLFMAVKLNGQEYKIIFNNVQFGDTLIIGMRSEENKIFSIDTVFHAKSMLYLESGLYCVVSKGSLLGDFVVLNDEIKVGIADGTLRYYDDLNENFVNKFEQNMRKIRNDSAYFVPDIFKIAFPQITVFDTSNTFSVEIIENQYWAHANNNWNFMFNSPFFGEALNHYMNNLFFPNADSIYKAAISLLRIVPIEKEKKVLYRILAKYENSKIVGFDNVFVDLALERLIRYKDLDSTDYKVIGKAKSLNMGRVGEKAYDFPCYALNNSLTNLSAFEGIFKVIFFFDPDCHHCQEAWPNFVESMGSLSSKGVIAVAVSINGDLEELELFLEKFGGADVENLNFVLGVESEGRSFREGYYLPSTPSIFVLNASNVVVGRYLSVDDIIPFLLKIGY